MPTIDGAPAQKVSLPCPACRTWNRIRADRAAHGPKCGSCGEAISLDRPIKLDDTSFDRVLAESDVPVLVDFYADWCGPCKVMAPSIEALAKEMSGKALIAKLDTDAAQRSAGRFQIRGIPTSIVFVGGREVKRQTGAVPLATLRGMLS